MPQELCSASGSSVGLMIPRLVRRLVAHYGIEEKWALWGIESWAIALGVLNEVQNRVSVDSHGDGSHSESKECISCGRQNSQGTNYCGHCGTLLSSVVPLSGKVIRNSLGMEFVLIKAGTFMMGSIPESEIDRNGNEVERRVTLTKDFYMQTTQVTFNIQYKKIG